MNRTSPAADTRYRILAYLFAVALLLSTGLNIYLLRGSSPLGLPEESADAEELAAVESELLQARSQLACCQRDMATPDSLALQLRTQLQEAGFVSENTVK